MIKDKVNKLLETFDMDPRPTNTNKFLNVEDIKEKTTNNQGHFHFYNISKDGNGETIKDNSGHTHKIITFYLQPAGEPSHKHKIIIKNMATGFQTNEFVHKSDI